jgi:hypothetical protein
MKGYLSLKGELITKIGGGFEIFFFRTIGPGNFKSTRQIPELAQIQDCFNLCDNQFLGDWNSTQGHIHQ